MKSSSLGSLCMRAKWRKSWPLHSLFHKIPATFLLYQLLILSFFLMSQLLLLTKIMNTFIAKFIVYFSVFTFLMFPVSFLSYIHLFIKYLMRTDTALDAGNTMVRKTHMVLSSDDRTKQPQQSGKSYIRGITGHMIWSRGLEPSLITFL